MIDCLLDNDTASEYFGFKIHASLSVIFHFFSANQSELDDFTKLFCIEVLVSSN